jgi:hypothetical protein
MPSGAGGTCSARAAESEAAADVALVSAAVVSAAEAVGLGRASGPADFVRASPPEQAAVTSGRASRAAAQASRIRSRAGGRGGRVADRSMREAIGGEGAVKRDVL